MIRVMVFGTFDILHPGHLHFLRAAKRLGDYLIVSIAREKFVKKIKGHDPHHSEAERKKLLQSVRFVDKVVMGSKSDYIGHIAAQKPDVIALGYDQTAFTGGLAARLKEKGLRVKIVRLKPYKPKIYKTSKLYGKTL